jgi:hypothetical protein
MDAEALQEKLRSGCHLGSRWSLRLFWAQEFTSSPIPLVGLLL